MIFNLEKTKKHMKMAQEIRRKQNDIQEAPGDMYGIDEALISFAYETISTKELKKIIKKEEELMRR
tara:strand:- start:99 stop:296 length:198 start_codon:yes stop_codon:yes gene_type:complete